MATTRKGPVRAPTVERSDIAGIPVFVASEHAAGPQAPSSARCALMFGVGRSDEALHRGGITHLVEHLTLFPVGRQVYSYNGFVDPVRTVFHAEGTPVECAQFLEVVATSLT